MQNPATSIQKINDLLFFDNLGLFYLFERTPARVLARALNTVDSRLAGSLLGLMNAEQRLLIHQGMATENDGDTKKNKGAADSLLVLARELILRGFVRKEGLHFFGIPHEDALEPTEPLHP